MLLPRLFLWPKIRPGSVLVLITDWLSVKNTYQNSQISAVGLKADQELNIITFAAFFEQQWLSPLSVLRRAGPPLCDAQGHCGLQEKSQPWLGKTIRPGSGPCQTASRRGRFHFCPLCPLVNPLCPLHSTLISITRTRTSSNSSQTTCPSDYLFFKLITLIPLRSDKNQSVVKKMTSSKGFN